MEKVLSKTEKEKFELIKLTEITNYSFLLKDHAALKPLRSVSIKNSFLKVNQTKSG